MIEYQKLLAEYVGNGSDAAFRELVSRYVNLVYSTALRLVDGDVHRAQDVTQTVFLDLASMAHKLYPKVTLGGWLHRRACFVAANVLRAERRRHHREQQAAEMNMLENHPADTFSGIAPILDEVINELGESDRTAILLRFFEHQDFRSVGLAIGSNEDAARMRVARAVEKLGSLLRKRGISASVPILSAILMTDAVQSAPVGLATAISTATALTQSSITIAAATAGKTIVMTALQKTVVALTLTTALGLGIYQTRQNYRLREELDALIKPQERLAEIVRERDEAVGQLASLRNEHDQWLKDRAELLKLRGEIGRLRNDSQEQARLKAGALDPVTAEAVSWKQRVNLLKQHLAQNPAAAIPELKLLDEQDWLNASRKDLETEKDFRAAASSIRKEAEIKFAGILQNALQKYLAANGDKFPDEVSQLQSYFNTPLDEALFQRYAILPQQNVSGPVMGGNWIISQKAPVDDELDGRTGIGPYGFGYVGPESWNASVLAEAITALKPVINEYSAAFGAKEGPIDVQVLQPFLKTPEQKAAFDRAVAAQSAQKKRLVPD